MRHDATQRPPTDVFAVFANPRETLATIYYTLTYTQGTTMILAKEFARKHLLLAESNFGIMQTGILYFLLE